GRCRGGRRGRLGAGAARQAQRGQGRQAGHDPAPLAPDRFVGDLGGRDAQCVAQVHRRLRCGFIGDPSIRPHPAAGVASFVLRCGILALQPFIPSEGDTMSRAHNFSAGPAVLPEPVLEQAQRQMLEYRDAGASIVELSHRGPEFMEVATAAERDLRALVGIPDDYAVLFTAGGATTQQALMALNFASAGQPADYVVTGHWGQVATRQAAPYVDLRIAASSEADGFRSIPARETWKL